MRRRVLLAGLFHQTNTFVSGRMSLEDFEIFRGGEMLQAVDTVSPLAGVVDAAGENGWEVLPALDMRADYRVRSIFSPTVWHRPA